MAFLDLLQKWNKVYNLTAVRDPQEMLTHHLLDSLAAVPALRAMWPAWGARGRAVALLDVGSGGGLPGVVFAICCPQMDVTAWTPWPRRPLSSSRWRHRCAAQPARASMPGWKT
jgi:16S rRNA (guanine527-N7)-methyltransferase